MHRKTGDKYLAGLWRGDILRGLMWHCRGRYAVEKGWLPAEYRAPSWSWASIESLTLSSPPGYFTDEPINDSFKAVILEVEYYPVRVSSLEKLRGGYIKLRARWCQQMLYVEEKKAELKFRGGQCMTA